MIHGRDFCLPSKRDFFALNTVILVDILLNLLFFNREVEQTIAQ